MSSPLCKDCRHCRPFPPAWVYFIPLFGQIGLLVDLFQGMNKRWLLAKCAVSFMGEDYTGGHETMFAGNSRKYGPCGISGRLFEE